MIRQELFDLKILDNKYMIGKTIGSGQYSKVKLCTKIKSNTSSFAIKIFKDHTLKDSSELQLIKNEINFLQKVKNDNVINIHDFNISSGVIKDEFEIESKKNVSYIVLDYLEKGELYDLVKAKKVFPPNIARFFFKQIVNGLCAIRNANLAHRDIKLENLVLDKNFTLKILDFGFACEIFNKNNHPMTYYSVCGSQGYMAPEVVKGEYKADKIDIFSSAVVLFCMLTGHPPFSKASKHDKFYALLLSKDKTLYWEKVTKNKYLNYDAIELLNKMFCYDPNERIDLEGIMNSDFYRGEIENLDEIRKFFS